MARFHRTTNENGEQVDVPFTPDEEAARDAEEAADTNRIAQLHVPQFVKPVQARLAIEAAGLTATVEAWLNTQPNSTRISWEYSDVIRRTSPLVSSAQAALGWTNEQVDQLFISAGQL